MIIKRSSVHFHNVLSTSAVCKEDEWHLAARDLRNSIIRNGLYATGPVIFQVKPTMKDDEAEYTFYIPVNTGLEMEENNQFHFHEQWGFEDGLSFRHSDLDEDLGASYEMMKDAAEANGLKLAEPFYNIYLEVYGGGIVDIFAPVLEEG